MSNIVFDIEADGFLAEAQKIHCISISQDGQEPENFVTDNEVTMALTILKYADKIIGHNIIGYDLPLMEKLLGWTPSKNTIIRDTYVLSQMAWPDLITKDANEKKIPKNFWGRYGLRAFGYRLGMNKGEVEDFTFYTPAMSEYCNQDVIITNKLWNMLVTKGLTQDSVDMEIAFARLGYEMNKVGIGFNTEKANDLYDTVSCERDELLSTISSLVPDKVEELKTPSYWEDPITGSRYDRKGDASVAVRRELVPGPKKQKIVEFNPMSRPQVAEFLIDKGWHPTITTPTGKPRVDEAVLTSIKGIPEALSIARLYKLQKLLAMLFDGKESWLKLVRNNRIHSRLKTLGTVSGRTSCVKPNLQQVPSPRLSFGKECRELFYPQAGKTLVGVDAKSLEVRCFAHYMAKYDGGEFAETVIAGDVHQENADLMKCDRQTAKNTFFALIYGASVLKISKMLDVDLDYAEELTNDLFKKRPAMQRLIKEVKSRSRVRGHLIGLDGRKLRPRSWHSAVNLLVQSAGAIVSKRAALNTQKKIDEHDNWRGVNIVGFIHDEIILESPHDYAEPVMNQAIIGFRETTEQYKLRCPMDGDGRVGRNWYEIH